MSTLVVYHNGDAVDVRGVKLSPQVNYPFSIFHINSIINNPEEWAFKAEKGLPAWGKEEILSSMLWSIFGAWSSEPDSIISSTSLGEYAQKAVSRMNNNEDTGLVYNDIFPAWSQLSSLDKRYILDSLCGASDAIDGFPPMSKIPVISTNNNSYVDIGIKLPSVVPTIVQVRGGIAGIVPIWEDPCCAMALNDTLSKSLFVDIRNFHLWNLSDMRVTANQQSIKKLGVITDKENGIQE